MTVRTPHFGLEAFVLGDVYLGVVDQRRFTTIDMHMAFISDIIGPGKISGWDISIPSPLTLKVSSGWGMIDRFITRTFGDYTKSLLNNNTVYVWMRMRTGIIGQLSAFCDLDVVSYIDTTAPSTPQNIAISDRSTTSITISWDEALDIDFDYYEIQKSSDNITYVYLNETSNNTYTDSDLNENSIYYYKVRAYDLSGNASAFTTGILAITDQDFSVPADPSSVRISNSDTIIHVNWNTSAYGDIIQYNVYVTPVNEERISSGDTTIYTVDNEVTDISINDLDNGQRYSIEIKAVSRNNIESNGVSLLGMPRDIVGPLDVVQIDILDFESDSGLSSNGMTISWVSDTDPYESFSGVSEVQIEEYRDDGTSIISEWIPVLEGVITKSIEVFPYKQDGQLYYKSINPRTTYFITVRNVDEYDQKSIGKRVRHYTSNFIDPDAVQSLSVTEKPNNDLVLRWENSVSIFSNNFVSVVKIDSETQVETTIVEPTNVGNSTYFILSYSYLQAAYSYIFTVYCVDEYDNASEEKEITFSVPIVSEIEKPLAPTQQSGFPGNKQNMLTWNKSLSENIQGYRIYRANNSSSIDSDSFTLLETVSSTTYSYTDYEVVNDLTYIYFVTAVNIYDQESLNPRDDRYISYTLLTLKPVSNSSLLPPTNLSAIIAGYNVQLTWEATGGVFDGYEIYRSVNNKYSFELLTTVSPATTYYVDSNALTLTSSVYYMVRKFRNEADLFVTESDTPITSALYLGKIVTDDGEATIDLEGTRTIRNLEDPIREEAQARLALHKHSWNSDLDDRRINLSNKLTVDDWKSTNNQTYSTLVDISDTTSYTVYINGEEASTFTLLYYLDKEEGLLTFENQLAQTEFGLDSGLGYPFSEPPVVTVEFDGLEEVQNIFPNKRLENLSAQQITSGFIQNNQIPDLNHIGRKKEKLVPVQISLFSVDGGYRYAPVDSSETLGNAVVFYDIIQSVSNEDMLVSSTSDGILVSDTFGIAWTKVFETVTPITVFFYSAKYDVYIGGSNRGVYWGRSNTVEGFNTWQEISGTENAKIIRGITEDSNGNVYCTADLGVYKLNRNIGQGSFLFQQTPIFGPRSTEAFAILYDSLRSRLLVSNELGVFESSNEGVLWTYSNEFPDQKPIYAFAQSEGSIFALTGHILWRRNSNESVFKRIAVFDYPIARKLVIWNDRVYITTDSGIISSDGNTDILTDETIELSIAFPDLKTNSIQMPATSLNVVEDKLFIGSENKLFISNRPGKIFLHSEFSNDTIPTLYVNGEPQSIGYRFTTSSDRLRKFISFDTKQRSNVVITLANQYKKFQSPKKGWADTNFISSLILFVNGLQINDISLSERPANAISNISLPEYNDRNAHKVGADEALAEFNVAKESLLEVERDADGQITELKGFTKGNVVNVLYKIERFLSQIYENSRVITITNTDGSESEIPFEIPQFRVALLSTPVRLTNTKFSSFGIYRDWIADTDNAEPSVIGNFGSELTTDGIVRPDLVGGDGDLGLKGGN